MGMAEATVSIFILLYYNRGKDMYKKKLYDRYKCTCIDGGYGWGETGAINYLLMSPGKDVKPYLPGGWIAEFVGQVWA